MRILEKLSNVAVIVAAVTVASMAVYDRVARPEGLNGGGNGTFTQRYKGKTVPLAGFKTGVTTVILFVSKGCHFCAESEPFYRRLAQLRPSSAGRLRLLAAVPQATETEADARTYFSERGITLDAYQPVPFRLIGVEATPTLALVSTGGVVTDIWSGKLSSDGEAEVLKRISSECNECFANRSAEAP